MLLLVHQLQFPVRLNLEAIVGGCIWSRHLSSSSNSSHSSSLSTSSSSNSSSSNSSSNSNSNSSNSSQPSQPSAANPLQPYIPQWCVLPHVADSAAAIRSAEFVSSAYKSDHLGSHNTQRKRPLPEVVVLGRSNVGKSSLINMLIGNKQQQLAKVSKTPGKTQSINRYLINRSWYLVDCPGYGYARRSQEQRALWHAMTQDYLRLASSTNTLADVLLLVDASLPPKEADLAGATWLQQRHLPLTLVFTKVDKGKPRLPGPADNISAFREQLQAAGGHLPPACFATSAVKGSGREALLRYLAQRRSAHAAAAEQAAAVVVTGSVDDGEIVV